MALVGKVSFIVGLLIAVVGGAGFEQAWFGWLLAIIGLIVGLLNVNGSERQTFLLAAIGLTVAADAVAGIPGIGAVVTKIVANLIILLGSAVLVVALRSLFSIARD